VPCQLSLAFARQTMCPVTVHYTETYTSTAACFPGTCIEKTESEEFGGDGKDRREESKGSSETEVPGQPV